MGQNGNSNGGCDLLVRLLLGKSAAGWCFAAGPLVDFNRDVRPILSDNCFTATVPTTGTAWRLCAWTPRRACSPIRGSYRIVAPGDPAQSRLLARIGAATPAGRMPLPQAATTLTEAQISTVRQWIEQGAKNDLPRDLALQCKGTDQASAALVTDLKQRGLLDDTLVVWGGEFGRTVYCQGKLTEANYGRDHHPRFTMWMAGGGVKRGFSFGET